MRFSVFMLTFATSLKILLVSQCSTKVSELSDMAYPEPLGYAACTARTFCCSGPTLKSIN